MNLTHLIMFAFWPGAGAVIPPVVPAGIPVRVARREIVAKIERREVSRKIERR